MLGFWEWMVARGQKVFHVGYVETSRTMEKTREAGAAMCVDPCMERMVEERGTIIVVRPLEGGQGGEVVLLISAELIVEDRRKQVQRSCWSNRERKHARQKTCQ